MKKLAMMAVAALAGAAVQAGTLLWLPLDEEAPGTAIVDGSDGHVTNAVNPATTVKACVIEDISLKNGSELPDYAPRYVKPHTGIQVYDPVSGAKRRNRAAMRFTTGKKDDKPSYYGSALRIPGTDTSINPKGSFTIECFFATRMGGDVSIFAPIIGKRNDSLVAESWAIYLVPGKGKLAVRLRTGTSGAKVSEYSDADKMGSVVNDGGWHHLAYVYDKTQGKAFIYVDYAKQFEVPTTSGKSDEDVHYYTGDASALEWKGAVYIGGYPFENNGKGYRKFNGQIDEIRISDEALSTDRFLRLQPEDDDELVRLRFDYIDLPGANENVWSIYANYNDRLDLPMKLSRPVASEYAVPDKSDKPAAFVRSNAYGEKEENVSSFSVTTNSEKGAFFYISEFSNSLIGRTQDSTNVDFTIECFFKARDSGKWAGKQHVFKFGSEPISGALVHYNASGVLTYTYNNSGTWKSTSSAEKTAFDGWHHLAVVNDALRKEMRFYFDGRLSSCANNVTNLIAANQHLNVCATSTKDDRQYFDGWIDDFRLMKRALRPEEFLNLNDERVDAEEPTVAFMNFEGDYAISPYPTLMPDEVVARSHADGVGEAPVFTARTRNYQATTQTGETNVIESAQAVTCDDSVIELPGSPLFEQQAFTVEFFANVEKFEGSGNMVRFVRKSAPSGNPVWAFYCSDAKAGRVCVRMQGNANGKAEAKYTSAWTLPKGWQNAWHHYAMTLQTNPATQTTTVEIFYDWKSLGAKTINSIIDYSLSGNADDRLMWGASADANKVFATFDALRFSRGVLTADQFIHKTPIGMLMLLR